MTRRRRALSPEERELWGRVAASARPIRMQPVRVEEHGAKAQPKKHATPPAAFRIGELSRPVAAAHDHAPMIEERLSHQPLRMDRRTHQQMLRGKLKPEARIDLHGMTLAEAHPELIRFVLSAQRAGRRMILVITGKGKLRDDHGPIPQRMGVLRHQLPHWLTQPPLGSIVLQVAPAHQKHGGGGAFYVYLRRS